jgi:hypothetical protein
MHKSWRGALILSLMVGFFPLIAPSIAGAGTLAPGTDCVTGATAPVSSYSIPVSTMAVGPIAANSLSPYFTNAAASITANTVWTNAVTKYLMTSEGGSYIAVSKYCARDMEIDSWSRNGIMYIRLTDSGDGLYFAPDLESNAWRMGIVHGFVNGSGFIWGATGSYMPLYRGTLTGSIPGYKSSGTDGDHFTFGAEGFDIYLKFNGVEFLRITDYRAMASGRAAIQANTNYGFRDVTVNHFATKSLLSDYKNNIIDARDFGMKQVLSTGSMAAKSNQLVLSSNTGFKVGDYILVEIGGESDGGYRGTVGIGGAWPYKSYATVTALLADLSQPHNSYAWAQDTGDVYYDYLGSWEKAQVPVASYGYTSERWYYLGKAIPIALHARITAVSSDGLTLTLSKAAAVSTTNANVYFDNSYVLNKLGVDPSADVFPTLTPDFAQGRNLAAVTPVITIQMPPGDYAIGQFVNMNAHPGMTLAGTGATATVLFSPKGAPSANVNMYNSPNSTARDFGLKGNFQTEGYGFGWWSYNPGDYTVETNGGLPTYPKGVVFWFSSGGVGRNLNVTDTPGAAFQSNYSDNVWGYNINVLLNTGSYMYIGWQIQWADSTNGGCQDCSVTSSTLTGGFESFKSDNTHFVRSTGRNVYMAFNDAGGFLVDGGQLTIGANSLQTNHWSYPANPMVNINTNVQDLHAQQGGTIRNLSMTVEGYIDDHHDMPSAGIVINDNNPNISIIGGTYSGPNGYRGAVGGPTGITSTGTNTIVDGFQVLRGRSSDTSYIGIYNAGIGVRDGVIKNCVADSFVGPVIQNCTAKTTTSPNFVYHLAGTAASKSQINLTWTAPSNPVRATSYQIFRNDVKVGTTITAFYSDSGLMAGTAYTYRVAAFYAQDIIANSGTVTVTTLTGAPPPPPRPSPSRLAPNRVDGATEATTRSKFGRRSSTGR